MNYSRKIDDVAAEILEILDRPDPHEAANSAAQAIAQARDAGGGGLRQEYLHEAQRHIARMDPRRESLAIQHLQGQILALQGRRGDTRIAHVTPREVVIPRALQTPEFMRILAQEARRVGIDPNALVVGGQLTKVNPRTGHEEFFEDSEEDVEDSSSGISSVDPPSEIESITVTAQRPPGPRISVHGRPPSDEEAEAILDEVDKMPPPNPFLRALGGFYNTLGSWTGAEERIRKRQEQVRPFNMGPPRG